MANCLHIQESYLNKMSHLWIIFTEGVQSRAEHLQRGGIGDVVVVLMSEQHVIDADTAASDSVGDSFGRVDEEIAVRSFDEIAVGLDHAASVEGDLRKRSDSTLGFLAAFGEIIHHQAEDEEYDSPVDIHVDS